MPNVLPTIYNLLLGNVKVALNYYDAYREEVDQALQDNNLGEERLKRLFPNLQVFSFPAQDGEQTS